MKKATKKRAKKLGKKKAKKTPEAATHVRDAKRFHQLMVETDLEQAVDELRLAIARLILVLVRDYGYDLDRSHNSEAFVALWNAFIEVSTRRKRGAKGKARR